MAQDVRQMVAQVLSNASVGSIASATVDWSIHIGATAPESPDNVIIVKRTGGFQSLPTWLLDFPTVQIMVRGNPNNEQGVLAKIDAVKKALLGLTPQSVLGDRIDGIIQLVDILDIPRDESNRPRSTYEIQLFVEPASDGGNRSPL